VSLWQVAGSGGRAPPGLLRGHEWVVYGVAWQPDGSVLASAGLDHAIRLWDAATGSCLEVICDLDHPDTLFWGVAWSPDGKLLAGATFSRGVLLWEVTAGSGRWIGRELPIWFRRVAFSPDGPSSSPGRGSRLAAGGNDGHVYVWDASDGTLLQRLAGHQGAIMSVAFSPDGSRLASGGRGQGQADSGELFVWDGHSGQRVHAFVGHPGVVSALSWIPSGEVVVSGGSDGMLRWWDLHSRECLREPCLGDRYREAHQGTVQALKLSPDGSMLASCGDDGAIRLWDLESGEPLHTLRRDRPYERLNITGIRGLTEAEIAT
jgi:WD40 repeat protein